MIIQKKTQLSLSLHNHQPVEEYYRGAIVGEDIFTGNTDFEDTIIFGDHVSGELFLLNIINQSVLISPFAYVQSVQVLKYLMK